MNQDYLFKEYKGIFEEEKDAESSSGRKKEEKVFGYSPFALQDAIGRRVVKNMWIEYQKLRMEGVEAEEIIHKMISKMRDMAAVKKGATKEDLGMKSDYPYNKSKRDFKNWKEEELENFYAKLVEAYHRQRLGVSHGGYFAEQNADLDSTIETAILSLS